jgi:hypothetical protein
MALLDGRKRFIVRIEEVDGKSFEYAEERYTGAHK